MVSLQKGLVGHWTMNDSDTSAGTLYDSSGHSRNGEINGDLAISQSGRVQQSYDFGSSNAYVQTSYSATPSPISICCWYYPNADGEYHALASKIDGNTRSYEVLRNNSNGVRFHVSDNFVDSNRTDLTSGNWFHICCTWDGSEAEIIINSESDITDNTLTQRSNSTSWRIGASPRGSNFADGKIDDVRLYNRVLTSNEISALYNMRSQRQQNITANTRYNSISIEDPNSKSGMDVLFDTSRSDVTNLFATNHDRTSINHAFEGQSTSEFGSANSPPYYMQQRPEDKYSWKLEGEWTAPETGTYTFAIDSDDASDVLIDDTAVTTFYGAHSVSGSVDNNSGTINLNAGERYRIAFRYEEGGGGSAFVVGYQKPSDSSYVLFPADKVF